jgi:hypothetical protein
MFKRKSLRKSNIFHPNADAVQRRGCLNTFPPAPATSASSFLTTPFSMLPHNIAVLAGQFFPNSRTRTQAEDNLRDLYTLLSAHPETLSALLSTANQRLIHSVLSKCLTNPQQPVKLLTIACLAKIAQCEPVDGSQDHPQSLFEGAKGAKVVKLAISTTLSALATPSEQNVELVRLCTVTLDAIGKDIVEEWSMLKVSAQHLARLKDKTGKILESDLLQAVSPLWLR